MKATVQGLQERKKHNQANKSLEVDLGSQAISTSFFSEKEIWECEVYYKER